MSADKTAPDGQPAYRFRWSNYDLDRYVEGRLEAAQGLRRDAYILTVKADVIEQEVIKLKQDLQEVADVASK